MELNAIARETGELPPGPPSALIFDWDNTLVDTWGVIQDALNTTLTTFGKEPWSMEKTRSQVRKSLRDSFPDLFGDAWEDAADVFYRRYEEIHKVKLDPTPGAFEMLDRFRKRGFRMGVVSNKRGDYLRGEAAHLGWDKYFHRIVGAYDAPRDKPAPDPVEMVLSDMKILGGPEVWFVGDADIDMECAVNAGCMPILIRAENITHEEFSAFPPALHFQDCMTLCNFVDNL